MAYMNLSDLFKGICDAIRNKKGITDGRTINHQDIPSQIEEILSPSDGSIPTNTEDNLTVSGATVTAPAGYYATYASKSVAAGELSEPTFTETYLSTHGKLYANSKVKTSGYLSTSSTGDASEYSLNTVNGDTITPGKTEQTAVPKNYFTLGEVKVAGDTNLKSENIKSGVTIFGVTGGYSGNTSSGTIGGFGSPISATTSDRTIIKFQGIGTSNSDYIIGFYIVATEEIYSSSYNYITSLFINGSTYIAQYLSSDEAATYYNSTKGSYIDWCVLGMPENYSLEIDTTNFSFCRTIPYVCYPIYEKGFIDISVDVEIT